TTRRKGEIGFPRGIVQRIQPRALRYREPAASEFHVWPFDLERRPAERSPFHAGGFEIDLLTGSSNCGAGGHEECPPARQVFRRSAPLLVVLPVPAPLRRRFE